jgi:hypothetical protein
LDKWQKSKFEGVEFVPVVTVTMMQLTFLAATVILLLSSKVDSFGSCPSCGGGSGTRRSTVLSSTKDNQAMAFLRRKGLVGGSKDFTNAIGIDEGPAGKNGPAGKAVRKASHSYKSCVESGIIDDFSEAFPWTSSGTEWSGFSDRVMGGVSVGSLLREAIDGRQCNILRGQVSLANNGGFIQMANDLANDPSKSKLVDASHYDGIELDVLCKGDTQTETFNVQ